MKESIDFLKAIGHDVRVYIRCLAPKNTPLPELEARDMTYIDKNSGKVNKSTVNGYIDVITGELHRRYGKDNKKFTDGWERLQGLNKQGYGVFFVVGHGGEKNADITHGECLFHESDTATLEQQQKEIDRITQELGKPTAVVKTKKSLHSYWASQDIQIDELPTYQRRWIQYSNCDDPSLADPSQIMRLPGFDHIAWNHETGDFDRVKCELLQLTDALYRIKDFDRILPDLDVNRWCKDSLEIIECDADDRDMRSFAQYLEGYNPEGRKGWITARCPAHNGESSDSLHIDSLTGGFICHAGCNPSDVYNAVKAVAIAGGHRFETESDDAELSHSINESLEMKDYKAPNLFGGAMGKLLRESADNFNIPTSILEFISLPVLASRIDSRTKLLINPGTDFWVPAIRWCGLVGETGTLKTPVIKRITKPISKHQQEIHGVYKEAKLVYDLAYSSWKNDKSKDKGEEPEAPIPMLNLFFSNYTIESLADSIQHHPDKGYLILLDELAQFAKSLDMYRGGKGSDRQQWLSLWDGCEIKVNRKTESIYVPQVSLSIVGGIQPQTIRNMISGDDSNLDGLWHRFSFAALPDTSIDPFTELTGDLTDELDKIYTALSEQAHQTYWLAIDAKPLWADWHYEMEYKRMSATQEMLKGIYPKFEGMCGRNALILHCTYAAIAGTVPDQLIPASTMETAIAWTKWELFQTLMQYQLLGLTDDPEFTRIRKFIDKFKGKDWVSTADVRSWWSNKSDRTADNIRQLMAKVVSLGYAIDNEQPTDSAKYQIKILEKSARNARKNPETNTGRQENVRVDEPAKSSPESTKPNDTNVDDDAGNVTRKVARKHNDDSDDIPIDLPNSENAGKNAGNVTRKAETPVNGHHSDLKSKNAGTVARIVNDIASNCFSKSAGKTGTFPNKNILNLDDIEEGSDDEII